jgi:RES domain-containing protein
MDLWRLTLHPTLDGEGGRLYPGRWNNSGIPMVYLAASPPGALIEILVHLELKESELPPAYNLLRVHVPDRIRVPSLRTPAGDGWKSNLALTRSLGNAWLRSGRSALARVPSAILPKTDNYLLNPLHPDAPRITVAETLIAPFDPRLIR